MKKMRDKLILGIALAMIMLFPGVLAEITLSQPSTLYNYGSTISLDIGVANEENMNKIVQLGIECSNGANQLYSLPLSILQKAGKVDVAIDSTTIKDLTGPCSIYIDDAGTKIQTTSFDISTKIIVAIGTKEIIANPGEEVIIEGTADKEMGEKAKGTVDLAIQNSELKAVGDIIDGAFSIRINIPSNMKSGDYAGIATVSEKTSAGETLNSGEDVLSLKVKQVPTALDVALNEQSIRPGKDIVFHAVLTDQAGDAMAGQEVGIIIKDNEENKVLESIAKTGQEVIFTSAKNSSIGYWKIETTSNGIVAKRLFYIEENPEVEINMADNLITVTNVGNVPYAKPVEFKVGEAVEVKDIRLEMGQMIKFKLEAPNGTYDVQASDGYSNFEQSGVMLSGKAIALKDIGGIGLFSKYPLLWIVVIAVFVFLMFYLGRPIIKRRFILKDYDIPPMRKQAKPILTTPVSKIMAEKNAPRAELDAAEHSLVLGGDKQEAGIVVVKIKNQDKLSKETMDSLKEGIKQAIVKKGVVYPSNEYIIAILSPIVSKTYNNDVSAVKAGADIKALISTMNSQIAEENGELINFGISINSGSIVARTENSKLRFTDVSNVLAVGKKAAGLADKDAMLTKNLYSKVMNVVKADKNPAIKDMELYSIKRINDREQHTDFIKGFVDRQRKEGFAFGNR